MKFKIVAQVVMRVFIFYFLIVFICVGLSSVCHADDISFYMGEVYPLNYVAEDELRTGAVVEIVSTIMRETGQNVNPRNIRVINWARSLYDVATYPNTAIFSVARTSERDKKYKWVGPIAELNIGLIAKKADNIIIENEQDVGKYKIGIVRGSAPEHILISKYGMKASQLNQLKDDLTQFKMLDADRVDLITQADTSASSGLQQAGLDPGLFEMVYVLQHVDLYIAFNPKTDDMLIEKIQKALLSLKEKLANGVSRYDEIMNLYYGENRISIRSY
nr:transporter substrate-binding domain-containing protein [Pseudodesulfovibrio sp.]